MRIEQIEDKNLAQFSYIIMDDAEIAVIDPARDPKPYEEYALLHEGRLTTIIETHSHADFVSGHRELCEAKEATIYVSKHLKAEYRHKSLEDGAEIKLEGLTLRVLYTPGHSADSISILLLDENRRPHAIFTGDTLLIGDVGRPDLRETDNQSLAKREELARQLYHSTREKLMTLPDEVIVYPGHGAGSLCGKNISAEKCSTIGEQKKSNPALQPMTEEEFVAFVTQDQPFIPKYFGYNIHLNRVGAPDFKSSIKKVPLIEPDHPLEETLLVIDARPQEQFKQGHLPGALNLQDGTKFETWLGAIIEPDEKFYLIAENEEVLQELICRAGSIGYEKNIFGALTVPPYATFTEPILNVEAFKSQPEKYTVLDVRNASEAEQKPVFPGSVNIPLPELRDRLDEVPLDKPVVVHCASGYRSAVGASILTQAFPQVEIYDLSKAIKEFRQDAE